MFTKGSILEVWLSSECASAVCLIIISLQIFYTTFFATFLFLEIQSFFFFKFSDFPWILWDICTTIDNKIVLETEFFLVPIFPHSDWIRRGTPGKYGPVKTPYLDTFHTVLVTSSSLLLHNWGTEITSIRP